ncbi:glycogen-binding subunit 76A-like [Acanthaster planci]|uniref:Glycogen-binding subunit 76A-like n=1 Tax=Acanthaster planci TaxID=133434 RepID=A0A8B7YFJ8_ACAPL|nr:glycogen-binding subunit 76A-like [Acanthaster planci]
MLARSAGSPDRVRCEEFTHINGFPFAPRKMTAKTLTNGDTVWNGTTTVSEMETTSVKSGRMKNVSRPPPIDIAIARSASSREDDDCDCDSGSSEDRCCEVPCEKTSQGEPGSPQFVSSEDSITSPTVTSPASVASSTDTTDGGILRRKSSIKDVTKTPETPGGKSVRFADALGLDLETVRDILESESPPDYPSMAAAACAVAVGLDGASGSPALQAIQPRYLSMSFVQPGGQPDFVTRVNQQSVCLENAVLSDFTVLGTIKVQNLSYHKIVKVRYSADGWNSFGDIPASYVQNSCDGPTDRFSFGLTAPRDMAVGDRLEFCICYTAGNQDYWDNNFGKNYALVCHSQGDIIDSENTFLWTHFL